MLQTQTYYFPSTARIHVPSSCYASAPYFSSFGPASTSSYHRPLIPHQSPFFQRQMRRKRPPSPIQCTLPTSGFNVGGDIGTLHTLTTTSNNTNFQRSEVTLAHCTLNCAQWIEIPLIDGAIGQRSLQTNLSTSLSVSCSTIMPTLLKAEKKL